jgi:hypothetical protein
MRETSRDFQAIIVVILIPFWQSCISYWVITVHTTRLIFLLVIINSFLAELYFLLGWKLKRTKANTACTALIYRTIYKKTRQRTRTIAEHGGDQFMMHRES